MAAMSASDRAATVAAMSDDDRAAYEAANSPPPPKVLRTPDLLALIQNPRRLKKAERHGICFFTIKHPST